MTCFCCRTRSGLARLIAIVLAGLCAMPTAIADLTTASTAPSYTAAGIVQAASQVAGALAPNSIATIYGTNLAFGTSSVTAGDLDGKDLPLTLDGVGVLVNGILSGIFFVSPGQVNFIIPYEITTATASVTLVRQGVAGPSVSIALYTGAPALFQWSGNYAVAQHADGSLISPASPAHAGEVVVLYATGLGRTSPDIYPASVPSTAMTILYRSQLQVLLNGVPCAQSSIYYAGVTPGFAGLYQINLLLPAVLSADPLGANPTIQLVMGAQASPPSVQLFVN
jgi:uncharacterized protein (TIGR03437 family)